MIANIEFQFLLHQMLLLMLSFRYAIIIKGVKQSVLSVYLSVSTKNHQIWRSRHHTEIEVSQKYQTCQQTYVPPFASRRLTKATSATNRGFCRPRLSATPSPTMCFFKCACPTELSKGHQVYTPIIHIHLHVAMMLAVLRHACARSTCSIEL